MAVIQRSLLFTLLLLGLKGFAQVTPGDAGTPLPSSDFTIHIDVNLVQVDATVTDKHGKPVADLKAEDFEILQDNIPQKITNFSYVSIPANRNHMVSAPARDATLAPRPITNLKPEQVQHAIALVVDDFGLSFESTDYIRRALKKFVDTQMQPGDLVAVVRTGSGMGALQQFTADKQVLAKEIDSIKFNFRTRAGTMGIQNTLQDDDLCMDSNISQSLTGVRYVVEALQELPGRKTVLLFSESMQVFENLPNIPSGANHLPSSGSEFSDTPCDYAQVDLSLRHLIDAAQRASVVIYTIDPRGVQTLQITAADRVSGGAQEISNLLTQKQLDYRNSQEGLKYLAEQTGGTFASHNDIAGAVRDAVEDSQSYYLIGYRPPPNSFDIKTARWKFHTIKVRLKRPGLSVRSRNGFFGFPGNSLHPVMPTRESQVLRALLSPFANSDIPLRLTAIFSYHNISVLTALLYIPATEITFHQEEDGKYKALIDAVGYTFDSDGGVVNSSSKSYTILLDPKGYGLAQQNGFVLTLQHAVKPGNYQLRVVIQDDLSKKIGAAMQTVEVPDLKRHRLALSGIVLKQDSSGPTHTESTEEQTQTQDPEGNEAVRIFKPGEQILWRYQILNAKTASDKQTNLTTQTLLWHNDHEVFTGAPTPLHWSTEKETGGMVADRLRLGSGLEPGDYVLQVKVADIQAKKHGTASQWIDFTVK